MVASSNFTPYENGKWSFDRHEGFTVKKIDSWNLFDGNYFCEGTLITKGSSSTYKTDRFTLKVSGEIEFKLYSQWYRPSSLADSPLKRSRQRCVSVRHTVYMFQLVLRSEIKIPRKNCNTQLETLLKHSFLRTSWNLKKN